MKKFRSYLIMMLSVCSLPAWAKVYEVTSPDRLLTATIDLNKEGTYLSIHSKGEQILASSPVSLTVEHDGKTMTYWGAGSKAKRVRRKQVDETRQVSHYKRSSVRDHYNELRLESKQGALILRAYDDGVAYRFVLPDAVCLVLQEQGEFRFAADYPAYVPYANAGKSGDYESQYRNSFEKYYTHKKLSEQDPGRLGFVPILVDGDTWKVCITEADLRNYPGMFLVGDGKNPVLKTHFAPLPKQVKQGGHNQLEMLVTERENFIARNPQQELPWRVFGISRNDADLAASDLVYRLNPSSQITDPSWIKPGKVAWEWWNDWNLEQVNFRAGINNETYKYYIDFASRHGIEYVILDEGWSVNLKADLMQVVPEIDLKELVAYGREHQVGIILWAGYWAFHRDMERVVKHYADMGVKGFKIDFMNRDDQDMVRFYNEAAALCARHHMLVDFHGAYKPTGMSATWPNVLNYEGVNGLEQMKWSDDANQIQYDVEIPFIRQFAGPMDYTQGAMRNGARRNFAIAYSEPMSYGTRCHQLGMYVVYDSPLNMLCDSPSKYMREQECTEFISAIPVVWDETRGLDGQVGEYICMARRKGDTWYLGALTNWTGRDVTFDLSFLPEGNYEVELFADGINADRIGTDYRREVMPLVADKQLKVRLQPGGGCAAIVRKK